MNGKGTGDIFGALWSSQVFSRIVVILVVLSVPFSPFCLTSLFFHFLGFPFGGDLSFILSVYYGSLHSIQ